MPRPVTREPSTPIMTNISIAIKERISGLIGKDKPYKSVRDVIEAGVRALDAGAPPDTALAPSTWSGLDVWEDVLNELLWWNIDGVTYTGKGQRASGDTEKLLSTLKGMNNEPFEDL